MSLILKSASWRPTAAATSAWHLFSVKSSGACCGGEIGGEQDPFVRYPMCDKHAERRRVNNPVQNAFPVRDQIGQVCGEVNADHVLKQSPLPLHVHCSPERAGGPIAGNEVVARHTFGFGPFQQGMDCSSVLVDGDAFVPWKKTDQFVLPY